jgi:hypothetical protein
VERKSALIICIHALCLLLLFLACSRSPQPVETTLAAAGRNRAELERALQHYGQVQPADSLAQLKQRAMEFLVVNMSDREFLAGKSIDEYHRFIDSVWLTPQPRYDTDSIYRQFHRTARYQFQSKEFLTKRDAEYLTADFLIAHVEQAFAARQQPWTQEVSFDDRSISPCLPAKKNRWAQFAVTSLYLSFSARHICAILPAISPKRESPTSK